MTDTGKDAMTGMYVYTATDDSGGWVEIHASSLREAKLEAVDWVRSGDWGTAESTIWVRVEVTRTETDEDENEVEVESSGPITVAIDPDEPECAAGHEHDWRTPYAVVGGMRENPGVWGHGGGYVSHDVCRHCGARRVSDSWAQDPETGEQGLDSVRYEERDADAIAHYSERGEEAADEAVLPRRIRALRAVADAADASDLPSDLAQWADGEGALATRAYVERLAARAQEVLLGRGLTATAYVERHSHGEP